MKKYVFATLLISALVMLAACSAPADSGDISTIRGKNGESAATQEPTSEVTTPESKYYFKDGVLVSEDVKIEIIDYKVIPAGEKGNDFGEKPVIAFWYKVTNITGSEDVDPSTAWLAMFTAVQDNNSDAVNELDMGMLPDDKYLDSQTEKIKKGGTVENAVSYELDDTTTPILLKATRGLGGEDLGEQLFDIAKQTSTDIAPPTVGDTPTSVDTSTHTPAAAPSVSNKPTISLEEYNHIEIGMTYAEVVEIVGSSGDELANSDVAGIRTAMYSWNGEGDLGANANAMFQNGELISKAQYGLK